MPEYKYYRPLDWGDKPELEDCYDLSSSWGDDDLKYVAEEAAEDYFHEHDGWECNWPLEFLILDITGKELGLFEVDMEAKPDFHAAKVKRHLKSRQPRSRE